MFFKKVNCFEKSDQLCFNREELENPYFAITDKDGNYTIEGVPPGKYALKTWYEKLKKVSQEVTVEVGKTTAVILS